MESGLLIVRISDSFFIILKGGDIMNEIIEKEIIDIESMIYEIRVVQVMLDRYLANLLRLKE